MVPFTRRRALQAAAGLLVGLAGCSDVTDPDPPSDSPTVPGRDPDGVNENPEHVMFRASEYEQGEPIVWFVDPENSPADDETVPPHDREDRGFIASEETAATLTVADVDVVDEAGEDGGDGETDDGVDETDDGEDDAVDGPMVDAAGLRRFAAETDFDQESLYLQQRPVGECYRRVLCYVNWNDDELETRYGEFLRDHDVACEADARDTLVTLIRLPRAVGPDAVTSGSTGVSRHDCFRPPGERGRPTPSESDDGTGSSATDEPATAGGDA